MYLCLLNLQSGPILAELLFPITVCGCSMFTKWSGAMKGGCIRGYPGRHPHPYFHACQLENMPYIYNTYITTAPAMQAIKQKENLSD